MRMRVPKTWEQLHPDFSEVKEYKRRRTYGQIRGIKNLVSLLAELHVKPVIGITHSLYSTGQPGEADTYSVRVYYK